MNQISHIITSMQPLTQQTGQIVVVKPTFTNTAAGVTANDEMFVSVLFPANGCWN